MPDAAHGQSSSQGQSSQGQSPQGQPQSSGRWLVKLPDAVRLDRLSDLNADLTRGTRMWLIGRFAATFCIGVAVALAWPYGDTARTMIANASPRLGWLAKPAAPELMAPDPQPRNAAPSDFDTVRDRIDRIAASQEQMTRTVAELTAGQAEIARQIAKVREVEQYLLYKTAYKGEETVPARPATTPAHRRAGSQRWRAEHGPRVAQAAAGPAVHAAPARDSGSTMRSGSPAAVDSSGRN